MAIFITYESEVGMIEIDGSYGEGGGQILRTALVFSAILKTPIRVKNVRASRKKPGLGIQHLVGVNAMARISGATVEGNKVRSQTLTFIPQEIRPGDYEFNMETAGSVTLVLQAIFLPLCLVQGDSTLILVGGTHVPWSPPFHYFSQVLLPALKPMGVSAEAMIEKWGFYPKGRGRVQLKINPIDRLKPISLVERGSLKRIRGISAIANLPNPVAERQKEQALKRIRRELKIDPEIAILSDLPSIGQGSFLFLLAEYEGIVVGFSSLGARGKPAEKVADEAVNDLKDYVESDGCVDRHLADQLVPFMALAKGNSCFTTTQMTEHLLTNLWVVSHFRETKIQTSGELGRTGRVDFFDE
jgi:RNA 3'-terminal phosphate cyclase (ATP)